MSKIILKNKPLVEVIFELKWKLPGRLLGMKIDPNYKILIGSIYNSLKGEYPFFEQLPTATLPDEVAGYIVQYRFRKEKNIWPLIQLGPGIITLNDTQKYVWEDFEKRIKLMLNAFFESYPKPKNINVNGLLLRYIDAIDFNYKEENIFNFLKEKMKIDIQIPSQLFEDTEVKDLPLNFDTNFSFHASEIKGIVELRFKRGKRNEEDALIWETRVQSIKNNVPKDKNDIFQWIDKAHQLTDDWFFKIIEGELQRRFE